MEVCHYDVLFTLRNHSAPAAVRGSVAVGRAADRPVRYLTLADDASTTNKLRHRAAGRPGAREAACVPALSTEQQP